MAEWRIGRGWTEDELARRLKRLPALPRNFSDPPERMTIEHGWRQYYSEAIIARGRPGPPEKGGPFERGRTAVRDYQFSDPRIVTAHFAPDEPLLGRRLLLELKALGVLRYLGGAVVGAVRSDSDEERTVFGFRYDTLEGHLEQGAEWFLLTKEHATGELRFRIEAAWRPGQFPNWWSRLGFAVLGPLYQRLWHHRAHYLMAGLVRVPDPEAIEPEGRRVAHARPDVIFKRYEKTDA